MRGAPDVLVLEQNEAAAGKAGVIIHFGFCLRDPQDIAATRVVHDAGTTIKIRASSCPANRTCSRAVSYTHLTLPTNREV